MFDVGVGIRIVVGGGVGEGILVDVVDVVAVQEDYVLVVMPRGGEVLVDAEQRTRKRSDQLRSTLPGVRGCCVL